MGRSRTIRTIQAAFCAATALSVQGNAVAQTADLDTLTLTCAERTATPEDRIAACTRLIDEAFLTELSDYATAHLNRADALAAQGRPTDALGDLDTALDYDPYFYAAYILRGDTLLKIGERYRAISDFTVAAGLNPLSSEPYAKRGIALYAHKEYVQAIADLETALGYDPANEDARTTLAWILSTAPDPALRDGMRALDLLSERTAISSADQLIQAAALAEAGRTEDALALYRDLAGHSDRIPDYLRALGYDPGDDFDAALRACLDAGCRIGAPSE
ncbi:tetratricopeptide repeat protein [Rhodospirillaceae bacterium KN72]|uniref:Tetratricopeptide repeat protein n=1 Tax=Pacificispira spongiicola TaxID=2729598 RepID=A0A7Y0HEZ0_9PROT|nr:tetratricopeptide repeat protein [Pacificispira spongiicola]NMM44048.1 tetratricopeptide repeat protein [Pacificispira spongiicola]